MLRSCGVLACAMLVACKGKSHAPAATRVAPLAVATPAASPPRAACTANQHTCRGDDLVECGADGTLGATIQTCKDGCRGGACADACATQGSELVYALTDKNQLLSFDPLKLPADPFRVIGTIGCGLVGPNSMAIDHSGIAWVVDHHSNLFRASILDAHCSAVEALAGVDIPDTFGMGFASDARRKAGGTAETLYVASDDTHGDQPSLLGRLDTAAKPITYAAIAPIEARGSWNPEFSGTGDGELFGYFPAQDKGGFVQELDRATGKARGQRWPVPSDSQVAAWAFAHWGGVFYVFATTSDGNSQVHAVRRKTGEYKLVREHLPYKIIGAGVSTCAPELERAAP